MSHSDVTGLLSEVDRARRRLYALLRSHDGPALARRPAPGQWSIIENVRHLLFAEQAHLGRFLPDGYTWSPLGLTSRTGKEFRQVGTNPTNDLEEVLAAWDAVHRPIRAALKADDGRAQHALERHFGHLTRHVEMIEKLLRRAASGNR